MTMTVLLVKGASGSNADDACRDEASQSHEGLLRNALLLSRPVWLVRLRGCCTTGRLAASGLHPSHELLDCALQKQSRGMSSCLCWVNLVVLGGGTCLQDWRMRMFWQARWFQSLYTSVRRGSDSLFFMECMHLISGKPVMRH